jgi:probable HAF family extracellular repeat protein
MDTSRSSNGNDRLVRNGGRRSAARWGRVATAISASALAAGVIAGPAAAATTPPDISGNYAFQTVNDQKDTTFNQLLGINNSGHIAGYFGSGGKGHPNRGFTISPPYQQGNFKDENVTGAAQTQVIALNNTGVNGGFWVDGKGANHGFYWRNGKFHTVDFPTTNNASPRVDQLLGVNDKNVAVGFYTDAKGANHGFSYSIGSKKYKMIKVSGDSNVTAAGINNLGDVAGFADNASGTTEAFLKRSDGKTYHLNFPGAAMTQAFGLNNGDEVVGAYTVGTGNNAVSHGFVWAPGFGFQTVNDANGTDSTLINGVNDRGSLVGFYTDGQGNTDGFVAKSTLSL